MWFNPFSSSKRSLENPTVGLNDPAAWRDMFGPYAQSNAGELVDEKSALGVPAIWQAVNAISGTIAHLPFHLFRRDRDGNAVKATADPLYAIIHDRVSDVQTSFAWRKWLIMRLLLDGRAISIILRNRAGRVAGFLPVPISNVRIEQAILGGIVSRKYHIGAQVYPHTDIIDLIHAPQSDGLTAYSPIEVNRNAIGLIIAAERYASNLFASGGVPPLVLKGAIGSPAANDRANDQINEALRSNRDRKRNILNVPSGFELVNLGFDPAKQQMIELRKFQISEVSRIFNIAPALLQDLTTGTYSNVEQQNLSFAQQTITPIVEMIEQEMNLKLFGIRNTTNFVEFNMDGLIRGDLVSRMAALSSAVSTGLMTPNEARALDNRPPLDGGDQLYVNGGTVPLVKSGEALAQPEPDQVDPAPDDTPEPDTTGE